MIHGLISTALILATFVFSMALVPSIAFASVMVGYSPGGWLLLTFSLSAVFLAWYGTQSVVLRK